MALRSPTVDKCFDCIIADPSVCINTCIDTAESQAGDGWVLGSVDSSIGLGTDDENFRDGLCAIRRADPNVTDPDLATEQTKRIKNRVYIDSGGTLFTDWGLDGDLAPRPEDGDDPSDSAI